MSAWQDTPEWTGPRLMTRAEQLKQPEPVVFVWNPNTVAYAEPAEVIVLRRGEPDPVCCLCGKIIWDQDRAYGVHAKCDAEMSAAHEECARNQ